MFGREKQNKKSVVIVKTKQELDVAVKKKEPYIEVQGELVKKMKWMKRLSLPQKTDLVTLLKRAGIQNGTSVIPSETLKSSVAAITGTQIALIIISGGLSITLIVAVLCGYNVEIQDGDKSILLTKK